MSKGRGIAIGESDFKSILDDDCLYIDKTEFIKDIIDCKSRVILITRPRRFGKTLNMSTLNYYLNVNEKENSYLFKDLKIMKAGEEYTSKQNQYPVIYISMNGLIRSNCEQMIEGLKTVMRETYNMHRYLLESDKIYEEEKMQMMDIFYRRENVEVLQSSIRDLAGMLRREYGKKVILLLDEYDVPIQNAYVYGYYKEAIGFFKSFYGRTFKDNPNLEKTVITGVSRVSKESIFSGANNFKVYTVLDNKFENDFGITQEEMEQLIEEYEIQDEKEEIARWYDGYKIGGYEGLYNPWSILNYLTDRELEPYWVNTSSNDLIQLILKNSTAVKEKVESLLQGETIEVPINEETVIVGIENNEDNIWGLMLGTGYLRAEEIRIIEGQKIGKVKFPNYEIKCLFEGIISRWFLNKVMGNDLRSILKDLITLNIKEYEKKFKKLVIEMFSYMDVGENTAENFYHAFVLGMLVGLKDRYYIKSNRESGEGRYDVMLEPKDKKENSFIMEFKVYEKDDEKTIEETIENAKKQIEEKGYETELRERGCTKITKMVYAFKGKDVKMEIY